MRKQRIAMDGDSIFELEIDSSSQASLHSVDHGLFDGVHTLEEAESYRRHTSRRDSNTAPLQAQENVSSSVPIAIPAQLMRTDSPAGSMGSPTDTFVPPHLAVKSTKRQHVVESLPVTTSAQIRTRNKVFQSTGFLPRGLEQGFLVSRTSTQPHIAEHSTDIGTDEMLLFNTQDVRSPSARRSYTRRMSLPAHPSVQKHVSHHPQRTYRLHLR